MGFYIILGILSGTKYIKACENMKIQSNGWNHMIDLQAIWWGLTGPEYILYPNKGPDQNTIHFADDIFKYFVSF